MPRDAGDLELVVPSSGARELLARCAAGTPRVRHELRASANRRGGSGGDLGRFVEIGPWFVKASLARRWESRAPEVAWRAEIETERLRQSLRVFPRERVWAIVRGRDGARWAVSVTRRRPTLRALFEDDPSDPRPWRLYSRALALAFETASARRVMLDCNPNNFGLESALVPAALEPVPTSDPLDGLVYLDDDIPLAVGPLAFGVQALLRLREYSRAFLGVRLRFVEELVALLERQEASRLLAWGVIADLETDLLLPREPELRRPLEAALARMRHAASRVATSGLTAREIVDDA